MHGQKKNLTKIFFCKKTSGFFRPPRPLLRSPLEGGALPGPPGPPLGGVPPKKGVAPPRAKKREKTRKKGAQYAKNGVFGGKNGHFRAKFALF